MSAAQGPIRVAVVNDYELVVVGVAALLEPYRDRVLVVEVDSGLDVVRDVDLVLYDTFGQAQGESLELDQLTRDNDARVVVYSWSTDPGLVRESLDRGACGYLSKGLAAKELVDALEQVAAGEVVSPDPDAEDAVEPPGRWPGDREGLTAREAEIIALITQGLSNQEIASRSYLSINSVKTYIRTAYRKMGVTRRSQAVLWGVEHGFLPDTSRRLRQHQ